MKMAGQIMKCLIVRSSFDAKMLVYLLFFMLCLLSFMNIGLSATKNSYILRNAETFLKVQRRSVLYFTDICCVGAKIYILPFTQGPGP